MYWRGGRYVHMQYTICITITPILKSEINRVVSAKISFSILMAIKHERHWLKFLM